MNDAYETPESLEDDDGAVWTYEDEDGQAEYPPGFDEMLDELEREEDLPYLNWSAEKLEAWEME